MGTAGGIGTADDNWTGGGGGSAGGIASPAAGCIACGADDIWAATAAAWGALWS